MTTELDDFMDLDDFRQVIFREKVLPHPHREKRLTCKKRIELAKQINEDLAYFASPAWLEEKRRRSRMTIKEIRIFAETKGINLPKRAKKADLIHLIQRFEGNETCYGTKPCANTGCLWHQDCIRVK